MGTFNVCRLVAAHIIANIKKDADKEGKKTSSIRTCPPPLCFLRELVILNQKLTLTIPSRFFYRGSRSYHQCCIHRLHGRVKCSPLLDQVAPKMKDGKCRRQKLKISSPPFLQFTLYIIDIRQAGQTAYSASKGIICIY